MICSGCNARIPFGQSACPKCGKDTNSDQQALVLSFIGFGLLFMGGVFAGKILLGAIAGVAVAFAVQMVHRYLQRGRSVRAPEPPEE